MMMMDDWLTQTRAALLDNNSLLFPHGSSSSGSSSSSSGGGDNDGNEHDNDGEQGPQYHYSCVDYNDAPSDMTGGRLVARFLSRFNWYYPRQAQHHHGCQAEAEAAAVSLDRAWAHYEHVTLGRIYASCDTNNNNNNNDDDDKEHQGPKEPPHDNHPNNNNNNNNNNNFVRAPPGERSRPTKLYPLVATPVHALGGFGTSVRLYFSTLLVLALFLATAAVLNVPLSWYFWQASYSEYAAQTHLDWAVQASAVCADTTWVSCDDGSCLAHVQEFKGRVQQPLNNNNNNELYFLKNTCDFDHWFIPGMFSYGASLLLLLLFGITFYGYQQRAEVAFDEQVQTASDYSIKICNPPQQATDCEEWRDFFAQLFGKVALVTVAVDNALLLESLVQRRGVVQKLKARLDKAGDGTMDWYNTTAVGQAVKEWIDTHATTSCGWHYYSCTLFPTTQSLYTKLVNLDQQIRSLVLDHDYRAVAVYVTFETERAQRNALHVLSTGKLNIWRNQLHTSRFMADNNNNNESSSHGGIKLHVYENAESTTLPTTAVTIPLSAAADVVQLSECPSPVGSGGGVGVGASSNFNTETHSIRLVESDDTQPERTLMQTLRFRGDLVLHIKEAPEPSDIRWKDLQVPSSVRAVKYAVTVCAMIWFIAWSGLLVWDVETNNPGTMFTPLFITVTNILVPKICEFVNAFENHSTEGARQSSLYIKVVLFRCFNSAFILLIVKGFTGSITLDEQDKKDNLNQAIYNLMFAEMFTIPIIKLVDVMGIVRKHILAPRAKDQELMNSYFVGAKFELAERYTDATKVLFVSLMYSAVLPASLLLGALALLVHYVVGKFCLLRMWRGTPDVGPTLSRLSRNYFFSTSLLVHVVMSAFWWSGYPYDDLCENENGGYTYCTQDFFRQFIFPPLARFQPKGSEWMTDSQATITSLYSWTGCVMIVGAILVLIKACLLPWISSFFYSSYEPDGKDQGISFSAVMNTSEMQGYLPQLRENGFSHPLIACDLSGIDPTLIGWKDDLWMGHQQQHKNHNFASHNLVEDARQIVGADFSPAAFSQVRQWK